MVSSDYRTALIFNFCVRIQTLIESGVIKTLSQLIQTGDEEMKLNCIWVVRNALYRSSSSDIAWIMTDLGWQEFAEYVGDCVSFTIIHAHMVYLS